jgi:hypothetical protein
LPPPPRSRGVFRGWPLTPARRATVPSPQPPSAQDALRCRFSRSPARTKRSGGPTSHFLTLALAYRVRRCIAFAGLQRSPAGFVRPLRRALPVQVLQRVHAAGGCGAHLRPRMLRLPQGCLCDLSAPYLGPFAPPRRVARGRALQCDAARGSLLTMLCSRNFAGDRPFRLSPYCEPGLH